MFLLFLCVLLLLVCLIVCLFVCFFCCFFFVLFGVFCRDSNMISIGKVEFRYYVVIIILVNLGKP